MSKSKRYLNVMVAGHSRTGKTDYIYTLYQTLGAQKLVPLNEMEGEQFLFPKTNGISPSSCWIECNPFGTKLALRLIDCPGLDIPNAIHKTTKSNLEALQSMANIYANGIIKFIEHQFEFTLEQESKVKRNPKSPDYQIHCLLYFLNPDIILGSKGITLIDKIVLERLCNYVNVIPCLAKSELVTIRDLQQIQGFIRRDMTEFTIFRFGDEPEDLELDIMMPFCIVNSEEYYKDTDGNRSMGINVNGEQVLGREYKWGTILVENPDQCDFIPLVNSILGSHVKELKDRTREWYYEIWRTENLTRKRQSVFIPTDLKEKLKSLEFEKEE